MGVFTFSLNRFERKGLKGQAGYFSYGLRVFRSIKGRCGC